MNSNKINGFTLVELMIVVAIVGILAMIAIPTYNGYVETSCMSAAGTNLQTLRTFEENYRIENDTYLAATHTAGTAVSASPLAKPLHWDPDDNDEYTYAVAAGATGIANSYVITVTGTGGCTGIVVTGNSAL